MEGTNVQIGEFNVHVEAIIAEGGFGYVYKVKDTNNSSIYALKKLNAADEEAQQEIENEINILKALQSHPHIMEFYSSVKKSNRNSHSQTTLSSNNHSKYTYFILTEFCSRGTLIDLGLPLKNIEQSCRIIYQIAKALSHIHELGITHRDIKAENILFDKNGFVKLCDFGSACQANYTPDADWTPLKRSIVEDEMSRHTTPLYRPPEILETYLNYPINCAIDIWALGCLVYYIRFGQHAFPDSGKLRIINCCYTIPKDVASDDQLVSIIKQCLKPDPSDRVKIVNLIEYLELTFHEFNLNAPVIPFIATEKLSSNQENINKVPLDDLVLILLDDEKGYEN